MQDWRLIFCHIGLSERNLRMNSFIIKKLHVLALVAYKESLELERYCDRMNFRRNKEIKELRC